LDLVFQPFQDEAAQVGEGDHDQVHDNDEKDKPVVCIGMVNEVKEKQVPNKGQTCYLGNG
jgi:hypothetical protein